MDPILEQYLTTVQVTHSPGWARGARTWMQRLDAYLHRTQTSVRNLSEADIVALLRSYPISSSTRATAFFHLRSFCRWAVVHGHLAGDPTAQLRPPRRPERAIRTLTAEEMERLLAELAQEQDHTGPAVYAACEVMVASGARVGEICRLRIRDLYLDREPPYAIVQGKRGQDRPILLRPRSVAVLRNYLGTRLHSAPGSQWVFVGDDGKRLSEHRVWYRLRRAAQRAGLPPTYPHLIRHTVATLALSHSRDLVAVQKLLGHQNIRHTLRYVHVAYGLAAIAATHPLYTS